MGKKKQPQCQSLRQGTGQECTLPAGHDGYHCEGNEAWSYSPAPVDVLRAQSTTPLAGVSTVKVPTVKVAPARKKANEITDEIRLEITRTLPDDVVIWRANRLDAMVIGAGGILRRVSAGIDGQGDLTGIVKLKNGMGVRLEIEVKAAKDRMRPSQIAFRAMILSLGGIYLIARSTEQCMADLKWIIERKGA